MVGAAIITQYRFPKVGQYDPPPSSVVLSSPSATRPSFQDRRPRVTAPANGAVAEARKWGADKWLEAPDPGPGHYYNPDATTFDAGNKGCTSSFMRSVRPRFPGDKGAGFLKVKHKLSPDAARKAKLPSFDLEASLRRPSRRQRRQRPRTSHSARKPRAPQTSARPLTAPAAHNLSWASGLDGPSGGSRGGLGVRTSVSQMARSQRRAMTPAQRREAFDLAEELQRVKELDFFSYVSAATRRCQRAASDRVAGDATGTVRWGSTTRCRRWWPSRRPVKRPHRDRLRRRRGSRLRGVGALHVHTIARVTQ